MSVPSRLVVLVLSASLWGGCATGTRGSWSTQFVKPGKPGLDLGGPAPQTHESDSNKTQGRTRPSSRPALTGLTVEELDPQLSAALLLEQVLPTAENHWRVAGEYRRLGILDASARHLDQALIAAPKFAAAHEDLARIWRDWGFPDKGLVAAYRATFYAPQSASAQNTLGTLLAALGKADEARRAYERALALDPGAVWAQNNLCDLERQTGRLREAEERCEAAIAIDPHFTAAHNNLALVFADDGDLNRARAEFLAAGDEASANYNMGLVHLAGGDYRAAADDFEAAIRLQPTWAAAKERAHAVRLYLLTSGQ